MFLHNNGDSLHCCFHASFPPLIRPELKGFFRPVLSSPRMVPVLLCSHKETRTTSASVDGEKYTFELNLRAQLCKSQVGCQRVLHRYYQLCHEKVALHMKCDIFDSVIFILTKSCLCLLSFVIETSPYLMDVF